jgi:hypothetical protein
MPCSSTRTPPRHATDDPSREETTMANDNRDFDCQECGAHFHSREELDRHNQQQHSDEARSGSSPRSQQNSSSSGINNRDLQR